MWSHSRDGNFTTERQHPSNHLQLYLHTWHWLLGWHQKWAGQCQRSLHRVPKKDLLGSVWHAPRAVGIRRHLPSELASPLRKASAVGRRAAKPYRSPLHCSEFARLEWHLAKPLGQQVDHPGATQRTESPRGAFTQLEQASRMHSTISHCGSSLQGWEAYWQELLPLSHWPPRQETNQLWASPSQASPDSCRLNTRAAPACNSCFTLFHAVGKAHADLEALKLICRSGHENKS